jgi:hypothetical protein
MGPLRPAAPQQSKVRHQSKRVRRAALCVVGDVLCFSGVFDFHIAEFFGIKDLATLQAFDKFGVFSPGDDSYLRVSAGGCHRSYYRLKKVLFGPDCSDLCGKLKPYLLNLPSFLEDFLKGSAPARLDRLEMPTEMVVY